MPEALLSVESVAGRLRRGLLLAVPLSDRLTVSQLLWLSASVEKAGRLGETAQRIYNLYRIARPVINPAGSVIAEVRGLIQDELLTSAKAGLKNRLTRLLVIEVGRAAVELYSGRMRLDPAELAKAAAAAAREGDAKPAPPAPPLRLLIAGQTNAGKSSLINALARSIVAQVTPLPGPAGLRVLRGGRSSRRDLHSGRRARSFRRTRRDRGADGGGSESGCRAMDGQRGAGGAGDGCRGLARVSRGVRAAVRPQPAAAAVRRDPYRSTAPVRGVGSALRCGGSPGAEGAIHPRRHGCRRIGARDSSLKCRSGVLWRRIARRIMLTR